MPMIDPRIVRFIRKHHLLTLATATERGPYCAHAFYAYDEKRNRIVFAADPATRHATEMAANDKVAAGIALETRTVGKLQGLQLCGRAVPADEEDRRRYLARFPFAAMAAPTLWTIVPSFMKFTDNTLGFGKKLIWNSEEQE